MGASYSRRMILRFASVLVVGFLSGCSAITGMFTGPPPDVVVFNRTNSSLTASLAVSNQENGNTILSETTDIGSGSAAEYPDVLASSGEYAMTMETNEGLSGNYEWSVSSDDQSLQVRINNDSIKFDLLSP